MTSPICLANSSSTTNGVNVAAGSTVTISLAETSGVNSWSIACTATDDLRTPADVPVSVNPATKTATFTMPGDGYAAVQFTSTVNNARDVNGTFRPDWITKFGIFTLYNGSRAFFLGQTTEGNAALGTLPDLNKLIRGGSGTAIAQFITTTAYVLPYTLFQAHSGVVSFATIPAKSKILAVIAETTTAFTGGSISDTQLKIGLGTDNIDHYLLAHSVFTTTTKGILNGDLGVELERATNVLGGSFAFYSASGSIVAAMQTIGGSLAGLTQGSTTVYVTTEKMTA